MTGHVPAYMQVAVARFEALTTTPDLCLPISTLSDNVPSRP